MSSNIIITADRNCGKTTYASHLIKQGVICKGIISLSNDDKSEYLAHNIETGESRTLLSKKFESGEAIGVFKLNLETFNWANECLMNIESGTVLIDEVGRLELSGRGFAPALKVLLKKDVTLYITVRTSFLNEVLEYFQIENYSILNGISL